MTRSVNRVSAAILVGCVSVAMARDEAPDPAKIDKVYFAQQHVLAPDHPSFGLVGDLEALVKVQVYSDVPAPSPYVFACLQLGANTTEMSLSGPKSLPKRPAGDPLLADQSYHDSFTAVIPRHWIRPGLKVAIELRDYDYRGIDDDDLDYTNSLAANRVAVLDRKSFDEISVGAPTRLVMNMFDFHFFGEGGDVDYPQGWENELKAKLPVADLSVIRVRGIMMHEIVMQPVLGLPSTKFASKADFKAKTGHDFDGEQAIALRWTRALKAAAGRYSGWRVYYGNICGVYAGGQGGQFSGVGSMHRHGVVIHELGHAFGLPHWANRKEYPYRYSMYGELQGEEAAPNAGPNWAFDIGRRDFIAPGAEQDGQWVWKLDPMQGGGRSGLKDYMFKHFSDYSVMRMRDVFNRQQVCWNEALGKYATWNQDSGAYDLVVENDGMQFPVERDVEVISIMASANAAVPESSIVYPPLGPYKAGVVRLFDAGVDEDRQAAGKFGYTPESCNVCLRVTQGGKTKAYLLPVAVAPDDDPLKVFNVSAINLPARDGEVTRVELLHDPGLIGNGLTKDSRRLYLWSK